jgi:hypothetical protein
MPGHLFRTGLFVLCATVGVAGAPLSLRAQRASPQRGASLMGTYAMDSRQLWRPGRDGCWLEAAPTRADSVRIQFFCRLPSPSHHLGVLDARLPLHGDSLVYEANETGQPCRIRVRFAGDSAFVAQSGSDSECGFGANVYVKGTYARLSKRRPPFDLAPIERQPPERSRKP